MKLPLARQEWMEEALCAQTDPELFFSENKGDWAKIVRAKLVCVRCPVKAQCLAYALENNEQHGVWGGTTLKQRQGLRAASRRQRGCSGLAS